MEAGLSPADSLRAASIWLVEFLGLSDSSGSIAVGKRADLLLLDDNPLSSISHTQRIHAVVLDGRLLQRTDLDALLDAAVDSQANVIRPRFCSPKEQAFWDSECDGEVRTASTRVTWLFMS